ncbi:MAG TPA: hypothetical protein VGW35_18585 [Methylomirabilota bacterium]|jgi:1,4-dihydroxy-2-naphthoyl-CoA synthase|nr:hypothetical protein [Methylomirabilota bacterium]
MSAEFGPATDELLYERRGAVAFLTFNRPQARNAMTWAMYEVRDGTAPAPGSGISGIMER